MKKKLLSLLLLFISSILFIKVNADAPLLNIGYNTEARIPNQIPSVGSTLYGTVTSEFDFSKVLFSKASGSDTFPGKWDLKKIILGELKNNIPTPPASIDIDDILSNWFTAYCLDSTKHYPAFGIYSNFAFSSHRVGNTDLDKVDEINDLVFAAVANNTTIQNALAKYISDNDIVNDSIMGYNASYLIDDDINPGLIDTSEGPVISTEVANTIRNAIQSFYQNGTMSVRLLSITYYTKIGGNLGSFVLDHSDIVNSGDYYNLSMSLTDTYLNKFLVTNNTSVSGYNHALWIIEHTYPTLSLEDALEAAGTTKEEVSQNISDLYSPETDDILAVNIENAVYGTVQYAIWKSTGYPVDNQQLGDSITNASGLNKLYQYLIANRDYSDYNNDTNHYTNKIKISMPASGKEIYKETDKAYIYGPYKATPDVLIGGDMNVQITNTDKSGLKIIDKNGNEINKVSSGQEFYVEVSKKANIGSVSVSVVLPNAGSFFPSSQRGRIYQPYNYIGQNVMSGGRLTYKNISENFSFVVNAKTGIENIALLLMVTLVAFSLGYLVLSYKSKPVALK